AVQFLMPALFVLLLMVMGYSMTTGFFTKSLAFLFTPDFSRLSGTSMLTAMGQAFFSLSLG
ncbi:MAG: sodium-dependent transporter, partial [Deltaproteobacteria bacterium]|nr:sodium-dependent transporter [Deltaproteobacteria bacterium]